MVQKVLVILGSARSESNTLKAIKESLPFSEYEIVDLLNYKIEHYSYESIKPDDAFLSIVDKMLSADVIVFATPVYWYAMSSRLKTFIDRFSDLITTSKPLGRALEGKFTYLFVTGNSDRLPLGFEIPFKCTSEYLKMEYLGSQYIPMKKV